MAIKIKDRYLIISLNDDLHENCHLLSILSDFENRNDMNYCFVLI